MEAEETQFEPELAEQRTLWRSQTATIYSLLGGKEGMFERTLALLREVGDGGVADLERTPTSVAISGSPTWRQLEPQLRTLGLIENRRGVVYLSAGGVALRENKSAEYLADLIAQRVRLFAEALKLLVNSKLTVEEVSSGLVDAYSLQWKSLNAVRPRLTWLEALGLIEWVGEHRLGATELGRAAVGRWRLVTPEAVAPENYSEAAEIAEPPVEIAAVLAPLADPKAQAARKTYNIWVPSPESDPNKIENMRISIGAASQPTQRDDLLGFIADRFKLKRSSVDSMLPFMRAGGFLQEVRRGVFSATPAAKAWLQTGNDIDFVRILHGHLRFVGELIDFATQNVSRADLYNEGARHGLNKEKVRWIASMLIDGGLLVETSYSSLQATPTGLRLVETLPLADPEAAETEQQIEDLRQGDVTDTTQRESEATEDLAARITRTAADPGADGGPSGAAFEEAVATAFNALGFTAQRIGGAGDTDVLVQWYDHQHELRTAVVDAKSSASGQVSHNQVSDVALSTHKDKHEADFVAIVAPSFAGNTIKQMAAKQGWALIDATGLAGTLVQSLRLGLRPSEVGNILTSTEGQAHVAEIIETRQRELDVLTLVIDRLTREADEDPLSPRDISLIERRSELAPTVEELNSAFELLQRTDDDAVRVVDVSPDPRHQTYQLGDARSTVNRLRSIAAAIERALSPSRA